MQCRVSLHYFISCDPTDATNRTLQQGMDSAVKSLLSRKDDLSTHLLRRLAGFLGAKEFADDWVIYNLCSDLLSLSPFEISTAQHGSFWRIFESVHLSIGGDWGFDASGHGRWVVTVNRGEHSFVCSYKHALWLTLRTLMDPRLGQQLRSVSEIPHRLMIIFLKHEGLRRFVVTKLWTNVEDSVDVSRLFHSREIGHKTMQELLDLQVPVFDSGHFETPLVEHGQAQLGPPGSCFTSLPPLPHRRAIFNHPAVFCSAKQVHLFCIIYKMIRAKLDSLLNNPDLPQQFFQIEFIFSLIHTTLTQSMDNQSSQLKAVHSFYKRPEFAAYRDKIDELVADIKLHMTGSTPGVELVAYRDETAPLAEAAALQFRTSYPQFDIQNSAPISSVNSNWRSIACVELPLALFFSLLESQACLFAPMLEVKAFLHERPRADYAVYQFGDECTLTLLQHTLGLVTSLYKSAIVDIQRDFFAIRACSKVFLICTPNTMLTLRLALLLEAMTMLGPVKDHNFVLNVFLTAFYSTELNTNPNRFATYCLASAMALLLGGKALQQLVAPPSDEEAYQIYCTLPSFMQHLSDIWTLKSRDALACFLALKAPVFQISRDLVLYIKEDEDVFGQDLRLAYEIERESKDTSKLDQDAECFNLPEFIRLSTKTRRMFNKRIYRSLLCEKSTADGLTIQRILEWMSVPVAKQLTRPHTETIPVFFHALAHPCDTVASLTEYNQRLFNEAQSTAAFKTELNIPMVTRRQMSTRGHGVHILSRSLPCAETLSTFLQLELSCRGGPEGMTELPTLDTFVTDNRLVAKLNLYHEEGIDFEDSFWLAHAKNAQASVARPYAETLIGTPIQNIVDLDILSELALQYPAEWKAGTLLDGTIYDGHYSSFMRTVLDNEVLDAQ